MRAVKVTDRPALICLISAQRERWLVDGRDQSSLWHAREQYSVNWHPEQTMNFLADVPGHYREGLNESTESIDMGIHTCSLLQNESDIDLNISDR